MIELSRRTASLATMEACNALKAQGFRALPETTPVWRFREILTKLGASLGLSGGAALYALDLMGLLTEADWRGDGRAVTYHSIRAYARKVGKAERTIGGYERQLILAGLVHRTVRHARRHGGAGNAQRRTGLDWRSFGARMPELLARLDARKAEEERRLDLEARIRAERHIVLGLAEGLEEGRAVAVLDRLGEIGVLRLRGAPAPADLEARLAALILLRADLAAQVTGLPDPVENPAFPAQGAQQSARLDRPIDDTVHSSCPSDIRCEKRERHRGEDRAGSRERPGGRIGMEKGRMAPPVESRTGRNSGALDSIPLDRIWRSAPTAWKMALGTEVPVSWPVLIEIADHLAPRLQVSAYAWSAALRVLGPSGAALALMVLDVNRTHPVRPVLSVGGALVGMVRRAQEGTFDLAPSLHGVLARRRKPAGNGGCAHLAAGREKDEDRGSNAP